MVILFENGISNGDLMGILMDILWGHTGDHSLCDVMVI